MMGVRGLIIYTSLVALVLVSVDGVSGSSLDRVKEQCRAKLDFDSIAEFDQFVKDFKELSDNQLESDDDLKICHRDKAAILELEKLVTKTEVCDSYKIEDLVLYHRNVLSKKKGLFASSQQPITKDFFTKYAIQVAFTCKKNLSKNVEIAQSELKDRARVFEQAKERVFRDEPSIKSNMKLLEEQPNIPASGNAKPVDPTELSLGEYRDALTKLQRPEDMLTFERSECLNNKNRETLISTDKIETFFRPSLICHQLHRYYAGSILSIARLANIGYTALDDVLDAELSANPSIRDWVIAGQVCEPLLFMGAIAKRGEFTVVDTCTDKVPVIEAIVYEDEITELDPALLRNLIRKSEATRKHAQKLMKSSLKKMVKIDIMKQLRSGSTKRSIFGKSLTVLGAQDVGTQFQQKAAYDVPMSKVEIVGDVDPSLLLPGSQNLIKKPLSEEESIKLLVDSSPEQNKGSGEDPNGQDTAVSFDPLSSIVSTLTVMALMLGFEWMFFVVMTLAARLCHSLNFNFNNLLTFPPKFLSWSDADFARFNERVEKIDEDDFYDNDELNQDEREQRELLSKVFGRPPPLMYRD